MSPASVPSVRIATGNRFYPMRDGFFSIRDHLKAIRAPSSPAVLHPRVIRDSAFPPVGNHLSSGGIPCAAPSLARAPSRSQPSSVWHCRFAPAGAGADARLARLAAAPARDGDRPAHRRCRELRRTAHPRPVLIEMSSLLVQRNGTPNELPSIDALERVFRAAGIGATGRIVVYSVDPLLAARAWFTLDYPPSVTRPFDAWTAA